MTKPSATYKVHIDKFGNQHWSKYDPENPNPEKEIYHNEHGPAYVCCDGKHKEWCINGILHRLDGPAVEYSAGDSRYYIDGVRYSKSEYDKKVQQILNPIKKMTIEEIQEKLGHKIEIVESK